jgi:hypothetical protein
MRSWARVSAVAALVMVAAAGVASAGPGGGGHGGGGGGHFAGGFHGGGGGWHGGYGGRGGYGWRGGYGGRGGYYGGYGWCCGGWGWGWGLGFYLPLLPLYYDTYWWGGIPYYYADGNYYLWDGDIGEYEAVEPPAGLSSTPPAQGPTVNPAVSSELFAYPKGGQSEAQQKQDKEECRRWATSESGFDPAAPRPGKEPDARQSYLRAEAACLEARNYSVR